VKSKVKEKIDLVLILGFIFLFSIGNFYALAEYFSNSSIKKKSSSYNQKRSYNGFDNVIPASELYYSEIYPQICSDDFGGAIIVWDDHRIHSDIYAQRVNSSGQVKWTIDGEPVCITEEEQASPQLCSNGVGGAFIIWEDWNWSTSSSDIYGQNINSSGNIQWSSDGVSICTASDYQYRSEICSDGKGVIIVTWEDLRSNSHDIYAQRINSSGHRQWKENGLIICKASGNHNDKLPQIIIDGVGGAFIIWEDWRTSSSDIYGQHINSSGDFQWSSDGVPICTASDDQYGSEICSDGNGGIIVTWEDYRLYSRCIYAQRINSTGYRQWKENGVPICTASEDNYNPQICSDGNGGAIITWSNLNHIGYGFVSNIRVQRVNSTGHIQWIANGTPICLISGSRWTPKILSDDSGGTFIFWVERRENRDGNIYGQRLNSTGDAQWSKDGVPICTVNSYKSNPEICNDTNGGVIVTWVDHRNGVDVYAQLVNSTGHIKWNYNGVPICTVIDFFNEIDDDDDDNDEEEAILGYNLYVLIGLISITSIIITIKRWKSIQTAKKSN